MSTDHPAWVAAKADIPRHDAVFSGVLYELDGNEWHYNRETGLWECQCKHCVGASSQTAERLSYADLTAEYVVSDWPPSGRRAA